MRSSLQSALMRAKSRAASAASSGMAHSTTLPTASILARNTASLLSVLTRSPAGLNIFDTAPTTLFYSGAAAPRLLRQLSRRNQIMRGPGQKVILEILV
jgi:hypothetical protein